MFPVARPNIPTIDILAQSQRDKAARLANVAQAIKNKFLQPQEQASTQILQAKAGAEAPSLAASLKAQQLANQLQTAKANLAPQLAQAGLSAEQAKTKALLAKSNAPFGGQTLTGPAGVALSDILFKKKFKDDPSALANLKKAHDSVNRSANAKLFYSMPSAERDLSIAKAKALGYDPVQAVKLFGEGYTLQDLANSAQVSHKAIHGVTQIIPSSSAAHDTAPKPISDSIKDVQAQTRPIKWQNVSPNFAPTSSVITRAQFAAQASAGLDYLGKYVSNNLNYGGITAKITRPWLRDAYSSDPGKQQKAVDYYVAQAIKPELALLRIKIQGGQPSARAMSVIEPTILGHLQVDLANLPARIQSRVQAKAVDTLNEAAYQTELQTLVPNPNLYNPKTLEQAPNNISSSGQPSGGAVTAVAPTTKMPTEADYQFMMKKYKLTKSQVNQRLGIK